MLLFGPPDARPTTKVTAVAVGLSLVTVTAAWILLRKQQQRARSSREKDSDENQQDATTTTTTTWTPLLPMEDGLVAYGLAPISTLTWIQGSSPPPVNLLKDRLKVILKHNPWLSGKLEKHPQTKRWGIRFVASEKHELDDKALKDILFQFPADDIPLIHSLIPKMFKK